MAMVLAAMFEATLQSGVLAIAVMLVVVVARRASAPLRAALLTVALLKFAVPPGLGFSLAPRSLPSLHVLVPELDGSSAWPLFAIWAAGSLLVLGCVIREWRRAAAILRSGGASRDPALGDVVRTLSQRLGLDRSPDLVVSPLAVEPFVWGLRRSRLVLPEGWDRRLLRSEVEMVLLHELAHLRRRDHVVIAAASWLAVIWWWNPLFWWVLARLRSAQEHACDDAAVLAGQSDHADYCGVLVRAARLVSAAPQRRLLQPAGLGIRALERRVTRLMDPSTRPRARLGMLALAATILMAAVTLPSPAPRRADLGIRDAHDSAHRHQHGRHHHHP
jgi:bla regulator protein blaR1